MLLLFIFNTKWYLYQKRENVSTQRFIRNGIQSEDQTKGKLTTRAVSGNSKSIFELAGRGSSKNTTISRAERPFSLRHWGSNGSSLSKTTVVNIIVFNNWELSLFAVFSVIFLFSLNGIFFVVNFGKRELLSGLESEFQLEQYQNKHVVSLFFWK